MGDPGRARTRRAGGATADGDGLLTSRPLPADEFAAAREACAERRKRAKAERLSVARGGSARTSSRCACAAAVPRPAAAGAAARSTRTSAPRRACANHGDDALAPSDYPLEYRLYPPGASMEWHRDEAMYAAPQLELVYTVENTSDSLTEWTDARGRVRSTWAAPNSLIVVRAEAALHRVLGVRRGEREIVKAVYVSASPCGGDEKLPAYFSNLDAYLT